MHTDGYIFLSIPPPPLPAKNQSFYIYYFIKTKPSKNFNGKRKN